MRISAVLLAVAISVNCFAKETITVCDNADGSPVAGASVISANGMIIGATDKNGQISANQRDFPLAVRCLGYNPAAIATPCDSFRLTPSEHMLSEVVVTPKDRPITRVVTYAREYCTGSTPGDTMQLYSEYMLEYFFAEGKVKGYNKTDGTYPRLAACRRYARIVNSEGVDSLFRAKYSDDIGSLSFLSNMAFYPYEPYEETSAIKGGAPSDTIHGKHFPKFIYRKSDKGYVVECDALSDYKDHKCSPWFFKLVGLTMDMTDANWMMLFNANDKGKYGAYDFVYGTYHLHVLGKGKLLRRMLGIKEYIGIDCYMEQYPVTIERLTRDDYLEIKKDYRKRCEDFTIPGHAQPLPPPIQTLVDRVNAATP